MKETLNIYTDKQDRKQIDNLKLKYQLSLTTIIDILIEITMDCLFLNTDKELTEKIKNQNLYERTKKTSIKKPRILNKYEVEHPSRLANNCLHIYLNREIGQILTSKGKADLINGKYGYYNRIEHELTTRQDNWYNYNNHIRMQRRMLRENKEYFKKELEKQQ